MPELDLSTELETAVAAARKAARIQMDLYERIESVDFKSEKDVVTIADHRSEEAILETIDEPILSSSLIVPDMEEEIYDQEDLYDAVHQDIDLFVDAGYCPLEPTTLLDLTGTEPVVLRMGQGVVDF